jgi:hypothetical protein
MHARGAVACHVLLRHGFALTLRLHASSADPSAGTNNINLLKSLSLSLSLSVCVSLVMLELVAKWRTKIQAFESNLSDLPTRVRSSISWILLPLVLLRLPLSLILERCMGAGHSSGTKRGARARAASWFYGAVRTFLGVWH